MATLPDQHPPATETPALPTRSVVMGILRQRCPRCREGRMFKGVFTMNDPCLVCGLPFEREPGYYFGAMYFSYLLAVVILVPLFFFFRWLLPDWSGSTVVILSMVPYLPLIPFVFRYSRVLWTYFDRAAAPSELSSNSAWLKWREAQKRDK